MEERKRQLYPDTQVNSLLMQHPLSITWLENLGVDPYQARATTLEEVCRKTGVAWETLLQEIGSLENPPRDSDWDELPICHLLEFLTREHGEFTGEFIPAIRNALATGEGDTDFMAALAPLVKAWPGFADSLVEHISGEESYLFRKILQYDYCLRHDRSRPDFSDGSVKVFAAVHLLREERKQVNTIRDFLDTASFSGFAGFPGGMTATAANLFGLLNAFQNRLTRHSRLEREVLYPRAEALEKSLYDRSIGGYAGVRGLLLS